MTGLRIFALAFDFAVWLYESASGLPIESTAARLRAVVRRLSAVEALGSVTGVSD